MAAEYARIVRKSGFLLKEGAFRKNWKKRFFVLSDDQLSYHKGISSPPIKLIPLQEVNSVTPCKLTEKKPPHGMFCVFCLETKERKFYMSTGTREEMDQWIDEISVTISTHRRRLTGEKLPEKKLRKTSIQLEAPKHPSINRTLRLRNLNSIKGSLPVAEGDTDPVQIGPYYFWVSQGFGEPTEDTMEYVKEEPLINLYEDILGKDESKAVLNEEEEKKRIENAAVKKVLDMQRRRTIDLQREAKLEMLSLQEVINFHESKEKNIFSNKDDHFVHSAMHGGPQRHNSQIPTTKIYNLDFDPTTALRSAEDYMPRRAKLLPLPKLKVPEFESHSCTVEKSVCLKHEKETGLSLHIKLFKHEKEHISATPIDVMLDQLVRKEMKYHLRGLGENYIESSQNYKKSDRRNQYVCKKALGKNVNNRICVIAIRHSFLPPDGSRFRILLLTGISPAGSSEDIEEILNEMTSSLFLSSTEGDSSEGNIDSRALGRYVGSLMCPPHFFIWAKRYFGERPQYEPLFMHVAKCFQYMLSVDGIKLYGEDLDREVKEDPFELIEKLEELRHNDESYVPPWPWPRIVAFYLAFITDRRFNQKRGIEELVASQRLKSCSNAAQSKIRLYLNYLLNIVPVRAPVRFNFTFQRLSFLNTIQNSSIMSAFLYNEDVATTLIQSEYLISILRESLQYNPIQQRLDGSGGNSDSFEKRRDIGHSIHGPRLSFMSIHSYFCPFPALPLPYVTFLFSLLTNPFRPFRVTLAVLKQIEDYSSKFEYRAVFRKKSLFVVLSDVLDCGESEFLSVILSIFRSHLLDGRAFAVKIALSNFPRNFLAFFTQNRILSEREFLEALKFFLFFVELLPSEYTVKLARHGGVGFLSKLLASENDEVLHLTFSILKVLVKNDKARIALRHAGALDTIAHSVEELLDIDETDVTGPIESEVLDRKSNLDSFERHVIGVMCEIINSEEDKSPYVDQFTRIFFNLLEHHNDLKIGNETIVQLCTCTSALVAAANVNLLKPIVLSFVERVNKEMLRDSVEFRNLYDQVLGLISSDS